MPKHSNLHLRKSNTTPYSRQPWQHHATNGFQKTTLRWVPKKVLQGQGYYTRTKQIWIPKKLQTPSFPTKVNSPIQGVHTCVSQRSTPNSTPIQRWVVQADYNKKKYKANAESPQQVFKSPTQLRLHEPTINPLNSNKSQAVIYSSHHPRKSYLSTSIAFTYSATFANQGYSITSHHHTAERYHIISPYIHNQVVGNRFTGISVRVGHSATKKRSEVSPKLLHKTAT